VEPSADLINAYRRAVFDDPSAASESAACLQLGRARLQAGDAAGADAAFGRALELAADLDARVAAWAALASVPYQHGDMAAVIDVCRMALDTISGAAGRNRALLSAELGWAEVRSGRPEQGRPHLELAADMLRADPGMDPDLPARTLDRLALARSDCGDHLGGLRAMEEAFRTAPPARPHLGAVLRMHRGRLLGRVGRAEEGLGDVLAAKRVFTARQDAYSTSVAHWVAAELLDQLGLLERALAARRAEIALLEPIENPRNLAGALIHVSDLLRRLGRVREAGAAAMRALDAALLSGDPRLVAWARAQTPAASGKVSGKPRP
jgi:tetratricopeptide (TPR) repeat protein